MEKGFKWRLYFFVRSIRHVPIICMMDMFLRKLMILKLSFLESKVVTMDLLITSKFTKQLLVQTPILNSFKICSVILKKTYSSREWWTRPPHYAFISCTSWKEFITMIVLVCSTMDSYLIGLNSPLNLLQCTC